MKKLLSIILSLLTINSLSEEVTIGWDYSSIGNIKHFKLYVGEQSGIYNETNILTTDLRTKYKTTNSVVKYFTVSAVGTNNLESSKSNEINYYFNKKQDIINPPTRLTIIESVYMVETEEFDPELELIEEEYLEYVE